MAKTNNSGKPVAQPSKGAGFPSTTSNQSGGGRDNAEKSGGKSGGKK